MLVLKNNENAITESNFPWSTLFSFFQNRTKNWVNILWVANKAERPSTAIRETRGVVIRGGVSARCWTGTSYSEKVSVNTRSKVRDVLDRRSGKPTERRDGFRINSKAICPWNARLVSGRRDEKSRWQTVFQRVDNAFCSEYPLFRGLYFATDHRFRKPGSAESTREFRETYALFHNVQENQFDFKYVVFQSGIGIFSSRRPFGEPPIIY